MRGQKILSLFVVAAASALAACASNGKVSPGRNAPAGTSAPATAVAGNDKNATTGFGYRRVAKDGQEYYCRREAVTGSRTKVSETCLTQAQMESARQDSQDFLRSTQGMPGQSSTRPGSTNPMGGTGR